MKILASPYLEHIDSNPIQSLLYEAMGKYNVQVSAFSTSKLLRGSWDVWHLHWPELLINNSNPRDTIIRLFKFWVKLKLARSKKTKIYWTAHNLQPHERGYPLIENIFWRIFLPNIDGIICLSEDGRAQLCIEHPRVRSIPTFVIPHGHYRGAYPDTIDKGDARESLQVRSDEFAITFLGQIRPYKGVSSLIRCFSQAKIANSILLIAGKPIDDAISREVRSAAGHNPNVRLFLDFVNRNDVQKFIRAADLVVSPYKEILNSGTAILALSFDRPILVPALGALAELRETVGTDWVRLYEGELSPEIICNAVEWAKNRRVRPDARAPLQDLNWDHIARATVRAFSFKSAAA